MRAHLVLFTMLLTIGCAASTTASGTPPASTRAAPSDFVLNVSGTLSSGKERTLTSTRVVRNGDRFHLLVTATERVDLYVAYCDSKKQLSVWPVDGSVALAANVEQRIPTTDDFNVDDNVGLESVFIVGSLKPLAVSDPVLISALLAAKGTPQACALELGMTTEESRAASNSARSPDVAADEKAAVESQPSPPVGKVAPAPSGVPAAAAKAARAPAPVKPDRLPTVPGVFRPRGLFVGPPRGSETATRSDASGIAIVALTFDHVP